MDGLFALAIIIVVGIPIAVIYLLVSTARLKTRVAALEAQLKAGSVRKTAPENVPVPQTAQTETQKPSWQPTASKPVAATSPAIVTPSEDPPKAIVLSQDRVKDLSTWLIQNWFYAVSALSLGLAGIFLVLYGAEQGLLPPPVRVMAAIVFGILLIAGGEYVRRRFGDGEDSATAYLPSTFSGAGIVTLFGAVLAARLLYGFIGPEMALFSMALVGVVAMVLGWFYGPLLAAVGVVGAMVAPFIIGGASDDPSFLLIYFAIITLMGLAIDTLQRWAWVSVISLAMGFGAGTMLTLGSGEIVKISFVIYCAALVLAAMIIPVRKLMPNHAGTSLSLAFFYPLNGDAWPEFPTRLVGGAVVAASGLILIDALSTTRADLFWTAIVMLSVLMLTLLVWAKDAPALVDLTVLPAAALVAMVAGGAQLWASYRDAATLPEADMPMTASVVLFIGVVLSITSAWRSLYSRRSRKFLALGAALMAPTIAVTLEVTWSPAETLGAYIWALHAMVVGAVMVVMAERFARVDGPSRRERASFAVLSALACIAFGVVILLSSVALTTAIAVTIVAAAWLDRQFKMPLMGLYILVGVVTVGYRLVVDPGLGWATGAPLIEVLMSYGGAVIAFAVSYVLVKAVKRPRSEVLLESGLFSAVGILVSILIFRGIVHWGGLATSGSHWAMGIGATVWITLGMAQLKRLEIAGKLAWVRILLGLIFLVLAGFQLFLAVSFFNPLFTSYGNTIVGPSLFNTLIPAYLLPAAVLAFGAWWLQDLPKLCRIGFAGFACGLVGVWLGLTIRHFWRGTLGMELPGIDQPELYSYTVVLLLIGAGLFYQSLARPSALLRKAGLLFIGAAVAKVFLLDIRGLGGLIRVFSFLFLGLSLAGLAWLNRWAAVRVDENGHDRQE